MFLLLIIAIALAIFYVFYISYLSLNYWKWKGVKYLAPVPIFGNLTELICRQKSLTEFVKYLTQQFPNERYFGFYQFHKPILLIKDLELIKRVTMTNFDNFSDHQDYLARDIDPLWANTLFASQGERRHAIRSYLTPLFTSNKLKTMFSLMNDYSRNFMNHFKERDEEIIEVEMRDFFESHTSDIILTTTFGIGCDSLKARNNEFIQMGKELSNFTGFTMTRIAFYLNMSKLAKLVGFRLIQSKVGEFFQGIVDEVIAWRKENHIVRPDLLNVLMNMKSGQNNSGHEWSKVQTELTEREMISQVLVFFFGGFDTTSSVLTFAAYELAMNPDIQDKLRKEFRKCNGDVSYEFFSQTKYADMVFSEVLRIWSPGVFADRKCTKDFTIEPECPGEVKVELKAGDVIWIPYAGLHKDPKHFPNPNKFNPERFNEQNKNNVKSASYNPFGIGPRACIGNRFAMMEAKIVYYYLLTNFELVTIPKTPIPLIPSRNSFTLQPSQGVWIGLKKLTN